MTMQNDDFSAWTSSERPSFLPSVTDYTTPQEDWNRMFSQVKPYWQRRVPMADLRDRLGARYYLDAPYMAAGTTPVPTTFSQFLGDWPSTPGYTAGNIDALRARAQEAALAGVTAPAAYLTGTADAPITPNTPEWNRRAWYAENFGSGPGSEANRMAVANLLALQRPGGGAYTGTMATAIRNAMAELAQQRLNVGDPRESFLNWYLARTAQTT